MASRGKFLTPGSQIWVCPICRGLMTRETPFDLHEALIPRSRVQNSDFGWLINHPCNVVLRHNSITGCLHEGGIGGDVIFAKCARQIIEFEGRDKVIEYLEAMKLIFPVVGKEALTRFLSLGE
jgi:hypothetical protein